MGFLGSVAQRGGTLFRLPILGFFGPAFSGFPQGLGRRALDEIIELSRSKVRLLSDGVTQAERATFQRDLGLADGRLRSARLLLVEALTELWEGLCAGRETRVRDAAQLLFAFSNNAQAAAEVADFAYRAGGTTALYASSPLQRLKRDMHAATQHILVGDHNFEFAGKALLGLAEIDPALTPAPRD